MHKSVKGLIEERIQKIKDSLNHKSTEKTFKMMKVIKKIDVIN